MILSEPVTNLFCVISVVYNNGLVRIASAFNLGRVYGPLNRAPPSHVLFGLYHIKGMFQEDITPANFAKVC
jgi:hypothetical protein